MEHTTFAKKTVVLAALGALSLMAATVRAAVDTETPTLQSVTVTIGGNAPLGVASEITDKDTSVTWDDAWLKQNDVLGADGVFGGLSFKEAGKVTVSGEGSFTIALPTEEGTEDGNDGKYVTFNGVNLTVKDGGAFSNSSYVKFTGNGSLTVTDGDFENEKGGVIELNGTNFDLSVTKADAVGDFQNAGMIVLNGNSTMTVGSGKILPTSSDDKLTLNVGNVTIGSGATLINKDLGYQVGKGTEEQAEGDVAGEEETATTQTLVQFGTVTVDGGQFKDEAGARSNGENLVIKSVSTPKAVEIHGTSVWNNLVIEKVDSKDGKLSDYVDIQDKGDFDVTEALIIDSFAENGAFTIDGSRDAEIFADGVALEVGKHVSAEDFTSAMNDETTDVTDDYRLVWKEKPVVGALTLKNFEAQSETSTEEPGTPEGQAEGDEGQTKPAESWTYKKLGEVTAVNTNIQISDNRTEVKDGYTPSLGMSSLNLVGTSMKIAYDADVEKIKDAVDKAWDAANGDSDDKILWTDDDVLEQIDSLLKDPTYEGLKDELEKLRQAHESALAGDLGGAGLDVESTISGSDLIIDTLSIRRNSDDKNYTVKVDKPVASTEDGLKEGTDTPSDEETDADTKPETVTITGDKTYDLGSLSLAVTDSNIDVGTLDLQTGDVTLSNTTMMVGNVKTLNGALTLKNGYLGLNVTKNVADHLKPKESTEGKADTQTAAATVEVGSPVTIGEKGKFTIGGDAFAYKPDGATEAVDYAVGIAGNADIVFDGKNFNSEALFSQNRTDGGKGIVAVDGNKTLKVKATNLSWGVYKLFDEDTLDTSALENVTINTDESSASGLWEGAKVTSGTEDKNQIVVGGTTIEGSGLDIGAVNLANSVVAGDRGSALDKALFNHILSNGKSLEEISNTINSITAMGAVAGLTALTVDFGAYVTDQVEHHAVTIPHQQEGWWVQGLAGKLKSDDLAVGGMKGGYSIDTVGIMGGFDKKLRNGDTIGVAASYQSGDADSEGEGLPVTTDVTNYGLHLWHARQFDAYRLMGMFSYSKTSGDAKMNYAGNELTSDLGATEISIGARADKEFQWGTVRMIPHAGVRASMIDVDDYTIEMGSEELFKVSEDKLWIFEVPVGVTFASSFEYARWNVQPYVDLTVRGRFGDTDSTFTLEGSNTSDSMKYDVTGDLIGDLRIGYMSTFQDLNLGMSYGLSAGDGGRQNHQLEATLRIDF